MQDDQESSFLYGGNAAFLESLYEQYLENPDAVGVGWKRLFDQLRGTGHEVGPAQVRQVLQHLGQTAGRKIQAVAATDGGAAQAAVLSLIQAYRTVGHLRAQLDPLGLVPLPEVPELTRAYHNLAEVEDRQEFHVGNLLVPAQYGQDQRMRLEDIESFCRAVYCGTMGIEFMHLETAPERRFIREAVEGSFGRPLLDAEDRRRVLMQLTAAEGIERYLHRRYVGQKRFSLEGGDSLIPQLDDLLRQAAVHDVNMAVLGMAHRGRLNVLVNVLGKSPKDLFEEFEGHHDRFVKGSGDVKYHMGFSADLDVDGRAMHVSLAFNPSHLEIVNPVILGSVKARQERTDDRNGEHALPILIHGDAAMSGQGVVMECFNMSRTRGYAVGGTVHIVINNQIGFTTSDPRDMRSSRYATDVAKMVAAPIFHVNGDDPEVVLFATRLALEFRMRFRKDVVVDLVCYRRHGHNEADEPSVTQPMMYQKIQEHPTTRTLYAQRLQQEGVIAADEADGMVNLYREALDRGENAARPLQAEKSPLTKQGDWSAYLGHEDDETPVETAVPAEQLKTWATNMLQMPSWMNLHPRVARIMADRLKMANGEEGLDWGFAETMAYASLLAQGYPVRLSGQDSGRGTFFHRHAVLRDTHDGRGYIPLQHVTEGQARFSVYDSPLSEEAVMGFEYGYSTATPEGLIIWEAQYGDFANGAQVVIDQFIVAGEAKWRRLSGLTLFLPHGYEGQGPEHSSARLERYLQLCAENNIQVCVPSTPAQMFHLLRRQVLRRIRKPLVVMTPKSLLRRRSATSLLQELTQGSFATVLPDPDHAELYNVRRVVLCSGKVFHDLLELRRQRKQTDVALVRAEELYPFPEAALHQAIQTHKGAREVLWCQEEPMNQGAWGYMALQLGRVMQPGQQLLYAGRPASASPAVGYHDVHVEQQASLLDEALNTSASKASQETGLSSGMHVELARKVKA